MKNKFGGFGGGGFPGGGNMQQLMKQAQAMQEKMMNAQQEIEEAEIEGSASGGLVKVVMNGNKAVRSVKIDASVCDPSDTEMLEDLLIAALNDGYSKADSLKEEKMGPLGGMGL